MQSIKQKPVRPLPRRHLPDFRNLGVVLRVLLLVNVLALLTALVGEPDVRALGEAFLLMLGRVQLPLFVVVLLLFSASPLLARLPYRVGAGLLLVASALAALVIFPLLAGSGEHSWRWVLWALGAALVALLYFDHLARRLTPSVVEARLMALSARIRPHFLFNALNGVLGVIRSDPRRAERALEELAELFRVLMRENRELVALGDEITLCRRYLDIESLRLGERLVVRWEIEPGSEDVRVPPLMVQPLLENAIYHGIEPLAEPGEVRVSVARSGSELVIEVGNPVAPKAQPHAGNRMALDNIRERLLLFFDLEARLDSASEDGRYRVTIRLPFRRNPHAGHDPVAGVDRG
ncbi:MAG: histidine kinase [Pseudazoarcus pumilus]|nr:histidine kinase [Pseudazoarcus pumilus]